MKQMLLFGTIAVFLFTHSLYAKKRDQTSSLKWKNGILIDSLRCEVRATGIVQKTDKPRMNEFAAAGPALLGAKNGKFKDFFVFLTDAWTWDIYSSLEKLGGRGRVVYKGDEIKNHMGISTNQKPQNYYQGDPVQIYIQWKDKNGTHCLAYEDFFIEKEIGPDNSIAYKPWTPHFVMHGSGAVNQKKTGCIACTHDCPGGIIGSNRYAIQTKIPVLKALWDRLPAPGTKIEVVFRPVPSGRFDGISIVPLQNK